jgi:hypothetical protein
VGIEADLKAILHLDREHDELSNVELEHIPAKREEIWSAMGAASRLLDELLGLRASVIPQNVDTLSIYYAVFSSLTFSSI